MSGESSAVISIGTISPSSASSTPLTASNGPDDATTSGSSAADAIASHRRTARGAPRSRRRPQHRAVALPDCSPRARRRSRPRRAPARRRSRSGRLGDGPAGRRRPVPRSCSSWDTRRRHRARGDDPPVQDVDDPVRCGRDIGIVGDHHDGLAAVVSGAQQVEHEHGPTRCRAHRSARRRAAGRDGWPPHGRSPRAAARRRTACQAGSVHDRRGRARRGARATWSAHPRREAPASRCGSSTLAPTSRCGIRLYCWKM